MGRSGESWVGFRGEGEVIQLSGPAWDGLGRPRGKLGWLVQRGGGVLFVLFLFNLYAFVSFRLGHQTTFKKRKKCWFTTNINR